MSGSAATRNSASKSSARSGRSSRSAPRRTGWRSNDTARTLRESNGLRRRDHPPAQVRRPARHQLHRQQPYAPPPLPPRMSTVPPDPPTRIPATIAAPPTIIIVAPGARLLNRRSARRSALVRSGGWATGLEASRRAAAAGAPAWYGFDWAWEGAEQRAANRIVSPAVRMG